MLWPKKIHPRNLMTKKNSCGSKIPLPPLTFLVVRPLLCVLPSLHLDTSKSFLDIKQGKEFL